MRWRYRTLTQTEKKMRLLWHSLHHKNVMWRLKTLNREWKDYQSKKWINDAMEVNGHCSVSTVCTTLLRQIKYYHMHKENFARKYKPSSLVQFHWCVFFHVVVVVAVPVIFVVSVDSGLNFNYVYWFLIHFQWIQPFNWFSFT